MKRFLILLSAAGLLVVSAAANAQAFPTATKSGGLYAGAEYSNANTDEFTKRIGGASIFATFQLNKHLGLEADVHLLDYQTPDDFGERSYLAGVRYSWPIRGRYQPYVKVMGGIGQTVAEDIYLVYAPNTPGTFGAIALGGGLDIKLPHKLSVRAIDYEFQKWPGFTPNGLSPTIISSGIAYRFH